ncbi:hypothetical protein HHL26_03750 [Sphingobium sp. TB-6]|mgnify:CR=1 FL=1|uniref:hypothetical protein n=1 Tax=Sphingobium sp. TB-6 TaxID=2728850 RepID=UPI00146AE80B|nr:hypothetical protein [Sphingobium sp. TB-6]NML88179.1 hypothetical protein [Sphingobium sp. TB-6]
MSLISWVIIGLLAGAIFPAIGLFRSYRRGAKERFTRLARLAEWEAGPCRDIEIPSLKEIDKCDPARIVFHCLVRSALVWGIDKNSFTAGPESVTDGQLYYYHHDSSYSGAYEYLHKVGLLKDNVLTCSLDELGDATDAAYDKGIDLDSALEEMLWVISYMAGWLTILEGDIISVHRRNSIRKIPVPKREIDEILAFIHGLIRLNYVATIPCNYEPSFRLTSSGINLFKKVYLYPDRAS